MHMGKIIQVVGLYVWKSWLPDLMNKNPGSAACAAKMKTE